MIETMTRMLMRNMWRIKKQTKQAWPRESLDEFCETEFVQWILGIEPGHCTLDEFQQNWIAKGLERERLTKVLTRMRTSMKRVERIPGAP